MAVDDLWYLKKRDKSDKRVPSQRHGRGKRWRVRNEGAATVLFDNKADADDYDAETRSDLRRGQYVDPRAGKILISEYGEKWRKDQLHRTRSADRVEQALRLHVYPVIGHISIADAKRSHIRNWVKDRSRVLAPVTLRHVYHVALVPMFKAAEIDRDRGPSPCVDITLPELPDKKYTIATPDQVWALHDSIAKPYRSVPLLVAGCGHRAGEVFGTELDDVRWLDREVDIARQTVKLVREPVHLGELKTKYSARSVELSTVVSESLAQHIQLYPPQPIEIEDRTDPRKPKTRESRLLFTDQHGKPMTAREWSDIWRPAVKAAGLPAGYGLRDLRHYYATLLIYGGANVKTVQMSLGHSTPTVTLNTYLGYWPDLMDRTRTLVDDALRRPEADEGSTADGS